MNEEDINLSSFFYSLLEKKLIKHVVANYEENFNPVNNNSDF